MPTAATTAGGTRQETGGKGNKATRPVATVPFIRASAEHLEPAGIDVARIITGNVQQLGVFDIPAYGYVRSIVLLVEATTGTGTGAVAAEDGPWSVLQDIALTEPNGAVIAQFNNGFELFLANKWGGYRPNNDPRSSPVFSAVAGTGGNFSFLLRIPIELSLRDALGSLPNQNAAATFKLRVNLGSSTQVFSTPPATTLPSVRVRAFLEAWDQPEAAMAGAANQTTPPAMNTTQFWSTQVYNTNQGFNTIRLTRVGNYIRNLIFILRDTPTTPARSDGETNFPDPFRLYLDTRPVLELNKKVWQHYLWERNNKAAPVTRQDSRTMECYVLDFTHEFDGNLGQELRDLWLPTLGSTRLEVQGDFLNSAHTLTVLTNDVAIAGPVFT
jgi:hypothetical protein